ncbi:hypothetical protein ACFL14_01275 [Patescibacteria group bacterium]
MEDESILQEWGVAIIDAWSRVIDRFIDYVPNIIGAIIILILGWVLAVLLEKLVSEVLRSIGLQKLFESVGAERAVKKIRVSKDTTGLLAALVKWAILIVTFIAAADVLQLPAVTNFLNKILEYLPEVTSAAGILLIGMIAAHFVAHLVRSFAHSLELNHAGTAGSIAKYSIIFFAVIAALVELGIARSMLLTLFTGLVGMLALAGGLAFGLGGQGVAKEILDGIKRDINHHHK